MRKSVEGKLPAAAVAAGPHGAGLAGKRALVWRLLAGLASLKLTLIILVLFGVGILVTYRNEIRSAWPLVIPLGLFAVNLTCAVITNPVFRRQTALLIFHLALISIVLLVAIGRLTYLKGQVEVATGADFAGQLTHSESGPWHRWHLGQVAFTNDGFTIDYAPGLKRVKTRNTVSWTDEAGKRHAEVIGDQRPLTLQGYSFYTTFNKGFAPVFVWYPAQGAPQRGTIHLPAYPINEYRQAQEWTLPDGKTKVWLMLQSDEVLLDPAKQGQFRLPREQSLVLRVSDERHVLKPGARFALPNCVLVYEGLTTWMGYTVFYDWTLPWLLAMCLIAVASLGWHFWGKFSARPWNN